MVKLVLIFLSIYMKRIGRLRQTVVPAIPLKQLQLFKYLFDVRMLDRRQ
jgi:hypothetical protein